MKPNDNNRICAEVSEKNLLQRKQSGNRENTERIMQLETGEICRGRSKPGSYSYAGRDTTEDECFQFMGFLKGKSSLIIFKRYSHLKYKYENRQFWCKGYYIDTAGKNAKKIAEYIQNQLKENQVEDQMTMKEYIDLFTGSKK